MHSYLKKILSATSILVLLSACNGSAPKPAKVDKTLPKVSINGYLTDMTSAAFEWKPISDKRVKGIYVYRNDPSSEEPNRLLQIDAVTNIKSTHYLDDELEPETLYYYSFATYAENGNYSLATKKMKVMTKPLLDSVSFFSKSEPMARAAKLVWRPHTDNSVVAYRLERRLNGTDKWKKVATIKGRLNAEYIDEPLKDNTRYEYRLKAVTFDGIVSKPTPTVTITTKALPRPITSLNASQGKAGQVTLSWKDDNKEQTIYYKIYRATSKDGHYKLIADKIKSRRYHDAVKKPGKSYYYKVVAVNSDKLEGDLKSTPPTLGTTIDAPRGPKRLVAMVENATVQLTWKSTDSRAVSFIVRKETDKGFLSSETKEFKNIKKPLMIDSSLKPGETYTFTVFSVDKHGIVSAPSNSVTVKLEDKR